MVVSVTILYALISFLQSDQKFQTSSSSGAKGTVSVTVYGRKLDEPYECTEPEGTRDMHRNYCLPGNIIAPGQTHSGFDAMLSR